MWVKVPCNIVIIVCSCDFEERLWNLSIVVDRLDFTIFKVNANKCYFFQKRSKISYKIRFGEVYCDWT